MRLARSIALLAAACVADDPNHLALRLGAFLLAHREHIWVGRVHVDYELDVPWEGRVLRLRRSTRGDLWELTPPIPVEVIDD